MQWVRLTYRRPDADCVDAQRKRTHACVYRYTGRTGDSARCIYTPPTYLGRVGFFFCTQTNTEPGRILCIDARVSELMECMQTIRDTHGDLPVLGVVRQRDTECQSRLSRCITVPDYHVCPGERIRAVHVTTHNPKPIITASQRNERRHCGTPASKVSMWCGS